MQKARVAASTGILALVVLMLTFLLTDFGQETVLTFLGPYGQWILGGASIILFVIGVAIASGVVQEKKKGSSPLDMIVVILLAIVAFEVMAGWMASTAGLAYVLFHNWTSLPTNGWLVAGLIGWAILNLIWFIAGMFIWVFGAAISSEGGPGPIVPLAVFVLGIAQAIIIFYFIIWNYGW